MSAAHRSLLRLPLDVYTDLIRGRAHKTDADNPEVLRRKICARLKKFPTRTRANGDVVHDSITNVGQLLTRISKLTLLRVLDPILTYEECDLFLHRVACVCTPQPESAFDLMLETESIPDLTTNEPDTVMDVTERTSQQFLFPSDHQFDRMRYLPTGVPSLDRCLRGGLRIGTMTELVGQAGAGKTQLAMQLCVMAARYRQGCIYIDTEKKLSLLRLQEIAEKRAATCHRTHGGASQHDTGAAAGYFSYDQSNSFASASTLTYYEQLSSSSSSSPTTNIPYQRPKEVLDNVTVLSPTTTEELLSALVEVEELILVRNQDAMDASLAEKSRSDFDDGAERFQTGACHHNTSTTTSLHQASRLFPVRLLIVDSIAAPTKRGFGNDSVAARAATMFQCAQRLKQLAHQLRLAVLVINQVYLEQRDDYNTPNYHNDNTHRNSQPINNNEPPQQEKVIFKAALGTSWHHCVSTRIMLEQHQQQQENIGPNVRLQGAPMNGYDNSNFHKPSRTASIVKSNVVGFQSTDYEIVGHGVVDAAGKMGRREKQQQASVDYR